jgi:Tol biopolymer transport system component
MSLKGIINLAIILCYFFIFTLVCFQENAEALIAFINKPVLGMGSDSQYEIYVMNNDGSNLRQLTDNEFFDGDPIWSPDGMSIAFYSSRNGIGSGDIYTMRYDGSNEFNVTNDPKKEYYEPDWSPDGQSFVMRGSVPNPWSGADLYTIHKDGTILSKIENLASDPAYPEWSPGGNRIATYTFSSPETPAKIVMINTDGTDKVELPDAGRDFDWSPTGSQLIYIKQGIWAVNDDGSNTQLLFNAGDNFYPQSLRWSPDGSKIAFVSGHESTDVMLQAIYFMDSTGANLTRVSDFMRIGGDLDWSPDQKYMVFSAEDENYYNQIFRLDINNSEILQLTFSGNNSKPRFSPLLDEAYAHTVPEAGTILLLGTGLAGAFFRRKIG